MSLTSVIHPRSVHVGLPFNQESILHSVFSKCHNFPYWKLRFSSFHAFILVFPRTTQSQVLYRGEMDFDCMPFFATKIWINIKSVSLWAHNLLILDVSKTWKELEKLAKEKLYFSGTHYTEEQKIYKKTNIEKNKNDAGYSIAICEKLRRANHCW